MDTINVLLLEDNSGNARFLQVILSGVEAPNFNVTHCKRLNEAKTILEHNGIDIVFINIHMRKNRRNEILSTILDTYPEVPVIALVGLLEEDLGQNAVQAGAQDFLINGEYDEEVLVRAIHYAISRKAVINSLVESEDRTRQIFESSPDGIIVVDSNQIVQFVNPAGLSLIGKTQEELVKSGIDFPTRTGSVVNFPHENEEQETTIQLFTLNITWNDAPAQLLFLRDITEKVKLEEKLRYMATHDLLTGIPNRAIFEDRLRLAIERHFRYSEISSEDFFFSIILVDLDDFKAINEQYGHLQGDKLLIECAKRLGDTMRDSDTIARFSGDEFMIIVENITTYSNVKQLVQRIQQALKAPIQLDDASVTITASMGISCYPCDGMDYQTLFKNADNALYRAKETKDHFCFYNPSAPNE